MGFIQRKTLTFRRRLPPVVVACLAAAALPYAFRARTAYAGSADSPGPEKPVAALSPYIDVHSHLDETKPEASMEAAIRAMPEENLARIVFMPSPFTLADANRFDAELLLPAAKKFPGIIYVLGGGGTLNPMIIEAARTGDSGPEVQKEFKERAEAILAEGAVGFGEMTAEHFPSSTPYQHAAPDSPLFLLLADIAAQAKAHKLQLQALILVGPAIAGPALREREAHRSNLYNPSYTQRHRKGVGV